MSLRRSSSGRAIAGAPWLALAVSAVAVGIAALAWRRQHTPPPMPRLPVRRKPPRLSPEAMAARLERLRAPAPEVFLPHWFWDADEEQEDDPAEIPLHGLSFVSEASQSAAAMDPAELEERGFVLHW